MPSGNVSLFHLPTMQLNRVTTFWRPTLPGNCFTSFGLENYVVHGEEFPLQGRLPFKKDLVASQFKSTLVMILKCLLGETKI